MGRRHAGGIIASLVGFVVLLFGATGVFGELQEAFERLWLHGSDEPPKQKWWHGATLRLRGVAYVMAFGFLLLVSLAVWSRKMPLLVNTAPPPTRNTRQTPIARKATNTFAGDW